MNTSEIEAFLAVVRYGNISKAAKQLFISQSTISQRIKTLETKLEVRLIERAKGITSIKLSKEGEKFYGIALKWEQLMTDSKMLKQRQYNQNISIAGVDSINNFVLNDLFKNIVSENSSVNYFIRTHQSNEIYTLVENNTVDIGFILQERVSEKIAKEEFFREELVLVLKKGADEPELFNLESLDSRKEVYINWNHDFSIWREDHLGYRGTLGVEVHTGTLIEEFLKTEGYWTIIPVSMAKKFANENNLQLIRFRRNKPFRICHLIYERSNKNSDQAYAKIMKVKNLIDKKIVLMNEDITLEI